MICHFTLVSPKGRKTCGHEHKSYRAAVNCLHSHRRAPIGSNVEKVPFFKRRGYAVRYVWWKAGRKVYSEVK